MEIDTQLKQAQEELKTVKQEITEIEENRLLVESVKNYGIFFIDPDGYVTRWNQGIQMIKHFKPEEVLGKHFSMFYTDEDRERGWPDRNLCIAREEGRFEEVRHRLRKGKVLFWADVVIVPLYNEQEELLGFAKIIKDITENKQWEDRLKQSNKDLEHFAMMASHDLQAPLRKLKTFSEQVLQDEKGRLQPDSVDKLERIQRSAERAQILIDDLLSLSKASQGGTPFESVNLSSVLGKVLSNLSDQIEATQAHIETSQLVTVIGDEALLEQLFQNLIENGLKYQPKERKPVIKINSGCLDEAGMCEISIQDNGIGFSEAQASQIFEPFIRLHGKSSPYSGTGIGLAICKRIVERHGGEIKVNSEPGQGSLFTVRLPMRQ